MTGREYRMKQRAKAQDETRESIVRATMALHDVQGVASTSFLDIAKEAGVGVATVYRHFPTLGALVMACGAHVWVEMDPPRADQAAEAFAGLTTRRERLARLAEWLDAFHARGEVRLQGASNDRERVPELDQFLTAVEAGVAAWVEAAVGEGEPLSATAKQGLVALASFHVFAAMRRAGLEAPDRIRLLASLFCCATALPTEAGDVDAGGEVRATG